MGTAKCQQAEQDQIFFCIITYDVKVAAKHFQVLFSLT